MADPTQDELVLKQFAQARKGLQSQKLQAQDDLNQSINRQRALTGMTGGRALKAEAKAHKGLEEGFSGAEATLGSEEAKARQAGQQFEKQFGLQERQFEEQKNQFRQQMDYQYKEFDENKKTNLLNAMAALQSVGMKSDQDVASWMNRVKGIHI